MLPAFVWAGFACSFVNTLLRRGILMNEKVAKALGYVDEKYISAAAKRKKKKHYWLAAVAAVLTLVILFNIPSIPLSISAKAVSIASEFWSID